MSLILYDYWRSSASYRVRIALNLLGVPFTSIPVDLRHGEQTSEAHLARNPQGLVPALIVGDEILTQSLAIIDYLDARYAQGTLLPKDALTRFHVQQISHAIAMDIHPICNPKVANYFVSHFDEQDEHRRQWMQKFIGEGLDAVEVMVGPLMGQYCVGNQPSMADCTLVPQLYNAKRWGLSIDRWPRLKQIDAQCQSLPAFIEASPEKIQSVETG